LKPDHLIVHHSGTLDGRSFSWPAIRAYHTAYKCEGYIIDPAHVRQLIAQGAPVESPWTDIGYHFGIELVDRHYEIAVGRMINEAGAHCAAAGMNHRSLGICFVGNFDERPMPLDQYALGLRLVRALMQVIGIPRSRVMGHCEVSPGGGRTCPGRHFDLEQFRTDLLQP
jgi:hypothetical protein